MAMSLITSLAAPHFMPGAGFATTTIVQVGITTIAWLVTAFVGPMTDRATLIAFVRRVKPAGPGWSAIRQAAGLSDAEVAQQNRIGAAFLGWIAGCLVIWSSLFAIGNFLYSSGDPLRLKAALILTGIFAASGFVLIRVTQQLWADATESQAREDARVRG